VECHSQAQLGARQGLVKMNIYRRIADQTPAEGKAIHTNHHREYNISDS